MKKIIFVVCVGLCSISGSAQGWFSQAKQADFKAALKMQISQAQNAQPVVENNYNEVSHETPAVVPVSDKPAYYVTEEAYQTCKNVQICEDWATQQAQEEIHFQVLSASLVLKEDLHHSRLIVKYVKYQDVEEKIFEETFAGWKEL